MLVSRVLIAILIHDDCLLLVMATGRCQPLTQLLLLVVEDFLSLLRGQIRLSQADHLLRVLRCEAAANQSWIERLPSTDILLRAQAIGKELLVCLGV